MNIDERLRQTKEKLTEHTVDKEKFIGTFRMQLAEIESTPKVQRRQRRLIIPGIATLLVAGFVVSPVAASALQMEPVAHVLLSWARGTGLSPYVRNVQQSSTDHGITMTITDVLYGPSMLSFGYTVSSQETSSLRNGAVTFGPQNGLIYVNGKQVHFQGIGQSEPTPYGYKGLVRLTDGGTTTSLPRSFDFKLVIHRIGDKRGTWTFTVPVSRKYNKPDKTFLPMVTKQIGNETVTITEVQLYPTGGRLVYDVTGFKAEEPPITLNLFDQNKQLLDTVVASSSTAKSKSTSGNLHTWSYSQSFRISHSNPTSLIVQPLISTSAGMRTIPLNGSFPVTIDNGMFGKIIVTGMQVQGKKATVHYRTDHVYMHFLLKDETHTDDHGVFSSRPAGSSRPNEYVAVYQFSKNVSKDQFVLEMQSVNNVFTVPLRSK